MNPVRELSHPSLPDTQQGTQPTQPLGQQLQHRHQHRVVITLWERWKHEFDGQVKPKPTLLLGQV